MMNQLTPQSGCAFSAPELRGALRAMLPLCAPPENTYAAITNVVSAIRRVLRAEAACVYESRGPGGDMTEMHRDHWRDWHTDSHCKNLNGRKLRDVTHECVQMEWRPPGMPERRKWHCISSCLEVGPDYYLTIAIARRAQEFSQKEVEMLRTLHDSGAFKLITRRRASARRKTLNRQTQYGLLGNGLRA